MKPARFASRLWIDLTLGDIRHRINEISEQFTGAGWKNLPQELVDEILGYLLGDLNALKASSLTCKHLFGATRPLIHQRLVCSGSTSTPDPTNPKGFLFSRRQRVPGVFERLIEADRSGVLRYTRHLTIKVEDGHLNQRDVEHLPHLRSIIRLHGLTLDNFHLPPFIPVFNEHFGMFTDTVRRLDIRSACGTELQLSYIICQFPLLEDLTIMSPAEDATKHGIHVPVITQSPPLRGTLVLVRTRARELYEGLAAFPSGLNFRSLELYKCGEPLAVFAACGRTVTSISYLWLWGDVDTTSLDLRRCAALERFEFHLNLSSLWQIHIWIHQTLGTVASTVLNEFVLWILNMVYPWSLRWSWSDAGWKALDALLDDLAELNPDFRVVVKGDFDSFRYGIQGEHDTIRWLIECRLPRVLSKGLVRFEQVPDVENRFWKLGIL